MKVGNKFYISDIAQGQDRLIISNNGNIGIGTTSPTQPLTVTGADSVGIDDYVLHNGDTNTKFGFNAADSFKVRTGGGDRFFIGNNDSYFNTNLGIGTSSPTATLELNSTTGNAAKLRVGRQTTATNYLELGTNGGSSVINAIGIAGVNAALVFNRSTTTTTTESMRIDGDGNVGINNTSPSYKLDVTGEINATTRYRKNGEEIISQNLTELRLAASSYWQSFSVYTAGSERLFIDSLGNVGVRVQPSNADTFVRALQVGNAALTSEDYNLNLMSNAYDTGSGYNRITAGTAGRLHYATDGAIQFYNASNSTAGSSITWNETMKISIDGDVLFNCTSLPTGATGGAGFETSGTLMRLRQSSPTTSTTKLQIYYNANGEVGSIHTSGTATAFNTSSDYRLKDDYKDFNGLDLVNNINVYDFEWKSDKTRSYGVKAHELQEVIPQAVNGEKDGKDMQQVDYSKLVPILLKSIQELKQEIEILKSK